MIKRSESATRQALEDRFQQRTDIASRFLESFVDDLLRRESAQASTWLAGKDPREVQERFLKLTKTLEFHVAVLLDADGDLDAVFPPNEGLLGNNMRGQYEHLDQALAGRMAVSNVVPSAAQGVPIVAFAAPFGSKSRPQVYSGGINVDASPMGHQYLANLSPVDGSTAQIIDSSGQVVASSDVHGLEESPEPVPAGLIARVEAEGEGLYMDEGTELYFSSSPIEGTPWTLANTAPTKHLYAPLQGLGRYVPWLIFAALVMAGVMALLWMDQSSRREKSLRHKNAEARDLAERLERSNEELATRNDEVIAMANRQRSLVSSASHELRTPLTSIAGFLELVLEGEAIPVEERGYLEIVFRNTTRLQTLVDDILLAHKIDSGTVLMEPEPIGVGDLLSPLIETFRPLTSGTQGIVLPLVSPHMTPVFVDQRRTEQILMNLLGNAVKFTTEEDTIRLSVSEEIDAVTIDVADTGPGIPADELARVFDRFYRCPGGAIPGTGLGLAIAKELAEAQGGRLRVKSVEGEGTTFSLTLPKQRSVLWRAS